MSVDYSTAELLAVLLARDLRDGERGAAGAAAAIPMAAIMLAREMHAPNLEIAGVEGWRDTPEGRKPVPPERRHLWHKKLMKELRRQMAA